MNYKVVFDEYIFPKMIPDIEKILEASRAERDRGGPGFGQVPLMLALLTHTEFMGSLEVPAKRRGGDREKFESFLRTRTGGPYKAILDQDHDLYGILRSRIAHRYFAGVYCTIVLFNDIKMPFFVRGDPSTPSSDAEVQRPAEGIGIASNGNFYFVVEQYLKDFKTACNQLYGELTSTGDVFQIDLPHLKGWSST